MKRRLIIVSILSMAGLCGACSKQTAVNGNSFNQQRPITAHAPSARINMAFASGDKMGMTVIARQNGAPTTMQYASVPVDGE